MGLRRDKYPRNKLWVRKSNPRNKLWGLNSKEARQVGMVFLTGCRIPPSREASADRQVRHDKVAGRGKDYAASMMSRILSSESIVKSACSANFSHSLWVLRRTARAPAAFALSRS